MIRSVLLLFIVLAFTSCGVSYEYEKTIELENPWKWDQPASFEFEISDTTKIYDLILDIGHQPNYKHENIYFKTTTSFPGADVVEDVLAVQLSNKEGQWLATCKSDKCSLEVNLASTVNFKQVGKHRIQFEQETRTENLTGLTSLSLKLLPIQK